MRRPVHVLSAAFALAVTACGGAFGGAPLVLTEVPNGESGRDFIARGASRSGCQVSGEGEAGLLLRCAEGDLHVPTFAGPPTFAVRCVDAKLSDVKVCRALVRKVLLAGDASP